MKSTDGMGLMDSAIGIGKILGITLRLHRAWIFVFLLFTFVLAGQVAGRFPGLNSFVQYGWGVVAALLFFISVVAHELGHCLASRAVGIRVHSITLHPLGGMARLAREANKPGEEFWIALAGPVMSCVLGVMLFQVAERAIAPGAAQFVVREIGLINILLAVFNLLPSLPLDGGRLFRAIAWWVTKDYRKATRATAWVGQGIAALTLMIGLALLFSGKVGYAFWLVLFGVYLIMAARTGYQQAQLREALRTITVGELGWEDLPQIPMGMSLAEFLAYYDFGVRDRAFLAMNGQVIGGVVTLADARRLHESAFTGTPTVRDAMQPIERFERISPQTDLVSVFEKMEFAGVAHLPVVANNEFQGFIGRDAVVNLIRERLGSDL